MTQVTVLITQQLDKEEKGIFQEYGIKYLEKPMIRINLIDFIMPKMIPDYLLITSQNAVRSILRNRQAARLKQCPVICVGRQTKQLLEKNEWRVEYFADYAEDVHHFLNQQDRPNILFFSGSLRSNTLIDHMFELEIPFCEVQVYETQFTSLLIKDDYGAVVFFSPSAVNSFCQHNSLQGKQVFCIGETTAKAVGSSVSPILPFYPSRKEILILCANQLRGT